MTFLLDANVLLRSAEPGHSQHAEATVAVRTLLRRGHELVIVPQNLYEFWAVATRPVKDNGLGMTPAEAAAEPTTIQARFALLPDTPAVFPEWRRLVLAHGVSGKPTHDARLVAAMQVHGVDHLLTFNNKHFKRFPGVVVHTPVTVAAGPP